MKRTLIIVGLLVGLLMMPSEANAQRRRRSRGTRGRDGISVMLSLLFGRTPRVYRTARARHYPRTCRLACCRPRQLLRPRRPRPQRPIYRQSTYFRHPGPGGYWVSRYGGQAYRHGPYLYTPIRSSDGVRRYRRIYVGH